MDSFLSLYNQVEYKIKQAILQFNECKKENKELKELKLLYPKKMMQI